MSLWPNGWMDEDATWYKSRSRPKSHCVRRRPSSPPRERGTAVPLYSAHLYCGHGCPYQLLLSSCSFILGKYVGLTVTQQYCPSRKKCNKTYVMYQYLQIYYRAISTWTALKELQLDVWEPVSRVWEPESRVWELASRVRELKRDVWELSSHQLPLNLTPG